LLGGITPVFQGQILTAGECGTIEDVMELSSGLLQKAQEDGSIRSVFQQSISQS